MGFKLLGIELPFDLPFDLDARKMSKGFFVRVATQRVEDFVNGALTPERLRFLLGSKMALVEAFPPDMQTEFRGMGQANNWISDIISDQEFLEMVPTWARQIVGKYGEEGEKWLGEQLVWLRGFVSPG